MTICSADTMISAEELISIPGEGGDHTMLSAVNVCKNEGDPKQILLNTGSPSIKNCEDIIWSSHNSMKIIVAQLWLYDTDFRTILPETSSGSRRMGFNKMGLKRCFCKRWFFCVVEAKPPTGNCWGKLHIVLSSLDRGQSQKNKFSKLSGSRLKKA